MLRGVPARKPSRSPRLRLHLRREGSPDRFFNPSFLMLWTINSNFFCPDGAGSESESAQWESFSLLHSCGLQDFDALCQAEKIVERFKSVGVQIKTIFLGNAQVFPSHVNARQQIIIRMPSFVASMRTAMVMSGFRLASSRINQRMNRQTW